MYKKNLRGKRVNYFVTSNKLFVNASKQKKLVVAIIFFVFVFVSFDEERVRRLDDVAEDNKPGSTYTRRPRETEIHGERILKIMIISSCWIVPSNVASLFEVVLELEVTGGIFFSIFIGS